MNNNFSEKSKLNSAVCDALQNADDNTPAPPIIIDKALEHKLKTWKRILKIAISSDAQYQLALMDCAKFISFLVKPIQPAVIAYMNEPNLKEYVDTFEKMAVDESNEPLKVADFSLSSDDDYFNDSQRYLYFNFMERQRDGHYKVNRRDLLDFCINRLHLCRIQTEIAIFDGFCYAMGESELTAFLAQIMQIVDRNSSVNIKQFVTEQVTPYNPNGFEQEIDYRYIVFNNGVLELDLKKPLQTRLDIGALKQHSPNYITICKIPHDYDPSATSKEIEDFFTDISRDENGELDESRRESILESIAQTLILNRKMKRGFIYYGAGDTGKSTCLYVVEYLLGERNCARTKFEDLENKFNTGDFIGKRANLGDDVHFSNNPQLMGNFKCLISGDPIKGEKKYKDSKSYKSVCAMIFTSNVFPCVNIGTGKEFLNRIIFIPFDYTFKKSLRTDAILTTSNMSALINLCLPRLLNILDKMSRGETEIFTICQKSKELMQACIESSNPLAEWACKSSDKWENIYNLTATLKPKEIAKNFVASVIRNDANSYIQALDPKSKGIGREEFGRALQKLFPELEYRRRPIEGMAVKSWAFFVKDKYLKEFEEWLKTHINFDSENGIEQEESL